jgi:hypothetical protein
MECEKGLLNEPAGWLVCHCAGFFGQSELSEPHYNDDATMKCSAKFLPQAIAVFLLSTWIAPVVAAETAKELPLYPGAAPGSEKWDWSERAVTTQTGLPMVQDVVRPVLLHYAADGAAAVGTAMIVAPGGGFRTLMMSYEGVDIARQLNAMGVDAFVLKYRLLYSGPGAPTGAPSPSPSSGLRPTSGCRNRRSGRCPPMADDGPGGRAWDGSTGPSECRPAGIHVLRVCSAQRWTACLPVGSNPGIW